MGHFDYFCLLANTCTNMGEQRPFQVTAFNSFGNITKSQTDGSHGKCVCVCVCVRHGLTFAQAGPQTQDLPVLDS
jgi:hypothetical protein